jgi:hypothetical protein
MGYNGIVNNCDQCAGVQRDANGFAWLPGEMEMVLQDMQTGEIRTVTRSEAFGEEAQGDR